MRKQSLYTLCLLSVFLLMKKSVFAAGPTESSLLSHPLAVGMIAAMILLLIIIAMLASKLISRARFKSRISKKINATKQVAAMLVFFFLSTTSFAQNTGTTKEVATPAVKSIGGIDPTSFYIMAFVLFAEVVITIALYFNVRSLRRTLQENELAMADPSLTAKPVLSWWDRFNKFRPAEQEADLDLGHDYDGIRELNNKLPPWWIYGFYVTIVFAVIYLWRFHVSHAAPSSQQEYERSVARAEAKINAYLKSKGSAVDENTVQLLTDAKEIAEGKLIFGKSCVTCHKEDARGDIGPNLTDDYWLHGGDIKSVFKIIRYGFNAMPPWQNAYSNKQIAQVASFVKSLRGTNPPNAKPPQGELYKEEVKPVTDSSSTKENKTTAPK